MTKILEERFWRGSWAERLLDCLYPITCLGCEEPLTLSPYRLLCPECLGRLIRLGPKNSCAYCAEPLGDHVQYAGRCPSCRTRNYRFTKAISAMKYDSPVKEVIHAFKFSANRRVAATLGGELAARLQVEKWYRSVEAVIPVPLFPQRERERGYNQALLLARGMAGRLGLTVRNRVLKRVRHTRPQVGLTREERLRNPRGAFSADLQGESMTTCLLVDDIMTTGATLSECALALREAGVKTIYVASAARAE